MSNFVEWMREDFGIKFLGLLLALLLAFTALLVIEVAWLNYPEKRLGVVVGMEYSPSRTSTGVGTAVGSNGQVGTVFTSNSESEKWTTVLWDGGNISTAATNPKAFYTLQTGQTVNYNVWRGRLTGWVYGCTVD